MAERKSLASIVKSMRAQDKRQKERILQNIKNLKHKADQSALEREQLKQTVAQIVQALGQTVGRDELQRERMLSRQVHSKFQNLERAVRQAIEESGQKAEFRKEGNEIQWRRTPDDEWDMLLNLDDIRGRRGPRGRAGFGSKVDTLSLTLASGNWTGTSVPYSQTVTASGVTASNNIAVGLASTATADQREAANAAQLFCTGQDTNEITVLADGEKPPVDIPISVYIWG